MWCHWLRLVSVKFVAVGEEILVYGPPVVVLRFTL